MRREVLWAAIIGIVFGLVIAFGAWRINSGFGKKAERPATSPSPKVNSEFKIVLDKPEDKDVVTEGTVTVSGLTKPLVWLTFSGEKFDYIVQADEKGTFSQEVNLIPGVNQIKLTAFDREGGQSIEKVIVVYSSSFQKKSAQSTPEPSTSSSNSAIREKVEQKVREALNKPKAYLGIVTDIADSTIQIKTSESEIKQISTASEDVTVVNAKGTANKTIKLTDIGIGDFIVAMGYVNSNSVLSAQRILVTDPVTEPKVASIVSTGKDVTPSKNTLVYIFENGKATKTKATNIKDEDKVIYVTQEVNGKSSPRTVFIVQ